MNKIEQAISYNTSKKFDDVKVGSVFEEDAELTQLVFYANGSEVKRIKFAGGGGGSFAQGGELTTTLPESSTIREKETVIIPYSFQSPNYGEAKLFITVVNGETSKDLEYPVKKQGVGSINIGTLTKGFNRISMYVVDASNKISNIVEFTIICGSLDITSTFDDGQDYMDYSTINIPFSVSALDASEAMTLNATIDGILYTKAVSNGYNVFTYPAEMKTVGVHHVVLQVAGETFNSNILEYNIVIINSTTLLVSSSSSMHSIEEGLAVSVPYRISINGQTMFNVKYYVNNALYSQEQVSIGANTFLGDYRNFTIGDYPLRIEASTLDGNITGSLELTIRITPGSFKRITHVTAGLQAYFNMSSKTNYSLDKEVLLSEVRNDAGVIPKLVLHDYNFSSNGWIDGRLVSNGKAWAEMIDYLPLEDNVEGGFTFDILYSSNNIGNNDARVIDCTGEDAPFPGICIDSEKAMLNTESNKLSSYYTDQTDTRITFVVNRTSTYYEEYIIDENGYSVLNPNPTYKPNPMVQIYVDGIFTEVAMLSDQIVGASKVYESIANESRLLINTDKEFKNFGNNSIKSIRIYNRPLSHEDVLQNYIADYDELSDQKAIYEKNYVTADKDMPTIHIYDTDIGRCDLMTKDTKQWVNIVYTSPNKDLFGESFDLMGQCQWQGTSSLAYSTKNYKFKLYDWARDANGDIIEETRNNTDTYTKKKINMYPADGNGHPENTFCLKADFMDSSHCRNTGTARLVNDLLFYGYDNPAKQVDPLTRDTINGFPCNLYINNKWMGIFNFNHDKSCTKTLGMETIPNTVRWEIKANSDTSAGAFYKTWTNVEECYAAILADFEIVYDEDAFEDKTGEYDVTKYYDELGFEHDGPVAGSYYDYAILSLARFVNFVDGADEETWKANSDKYFNKIQACRYYLNTMTLGLIDNFAKNCIINMYGDDIWWFSFYDLDSSLGLDNTGYNKFECNIEPSQPGIYNCSTSKMWVKLNDWNQNDLFDQFKIIREGNYTYENVCKYLIEKQIDVIPQLLYNRDMEAKYISQGRQYLHMLHGNNKDHLKRWLYNRFLYVDSLFLQHNSPYTKQNITIRSCKPTNAVPKYDAEGNIISQYTARFEIQTYSPQYVTVCWRKNTFETKRIDFGETVVFENDMVNSQDNEIIIYCASNLKHLGDCSNLNPTSVDIGNANRLIEFVIEGSDKLIKADLSKNKYLTNVSFKNCSVLGTASGGSNVLDISECTNLKTIDIRGTQLTSLVTNGAGGNLEEIYYPESIQTAIVSNQINLRILGLPTNATNLVNTQIVNCNNIETTIYPYDESNTILDGVRYSQNLTIDNSLKLDAFSIKGFSKLKTLEIRNCINLKELNFFNMMKKDEAATLGDMVLVNLGVTSLDFSCSSDDYAIKFLPGSELNFGSLTTLKSITSNCAIQGVEEIILPLDIETVSFSPEFGEGTCDIERLYSVDAVGNHLTNDSCIDLKNMVLKNFDFSNLLKISSLMNLYVKLKTKGDIVDLNVNRDGSEEKPYLALTYCTLDISEYTDTVNRLFNFFGDNFETVNIIYKEQEEGEYEEKTYMPQTDLSYMFADNKYITKEIVEEILSHWNISKATNLAGMFKNCINITSLELSEWGVEKVVPIHEMFSGCINLESIDGIGYFSVTGLTNLNALFRDCHKITELDLSSWDVSNVSSMDYMFTNCYELIKFGGFLWKVTSLVSAIALFANCKKLVMDDSENAFMWCASGSTSNLRYIFNEDPDNPLSMFTGCESMTYFCRYVEGYNTYNFSFDNKIENMSYMFANSGLRFLDISLIDRHTGFVNMSHMFENCTSFTSFSVSRSPFHMKITDMSYMFYNCTALEYFISTYIIDFSNVTDMSYMFYNCINLIGSDSGFGDTRWDLSKVENMSHMLYNCGKVEKVALGSSKTTSLKNADNMFYGCSSIGELDISIMDTRKLTNINYLLNGCTSLEKITLGSDFKVDHFTELIGVFQNCSSLPMLDLKYWNVDNIKNMSNLFNGCSSLVTINMENFNISTDCNISNMFTSTSKLKLINCKVQQSINVLAGALITSPGGNIITNTTNGITSNNISTLKNKKWNITTSPRTLARYKINADLAGDQPEISNFYEYIISNESVEDNIITQTLQCISTGNANSIYFKNTNVIEIEKLDVSPFKAVSFTGSEHLVTVNASDWNTSNIKTISFYGCKSLTTINGISNWNTSSLTGMRDMFRGCQKLTSLDLSKWKTGNVTDMYQVFYGCSSLTTLDVSTWDTSNAATMYAMFQDCDKLTSLDLSNWNVRKVTVMQSMFYNCSSLTSIGNVSKWNTSAVKYMYGMFDGCSSLLALEGISNWNVSGVTSMASMFDGCSSLKALDLSTWSPHPTSLYYMFGHCTSLESLDLRKFNVTEVTDMSNAFMNCRSLKTLNLANWNAPKTTNMQYMFYYCSSLETLNTTGFIIKNVTAINYAFNYCSSLKTLDLSGWDVSNLNSYNSVWYNTSFYLENFDSFTNIRTSMQMPSTLTHDSLVDVIANLSTVIGKTLTLGATNLAKLTPEEIAVATNKGWTVV
jgi:surface protein